MKMPMRTWGVGGWGGGVEQEEGGGLAKTMSVGLGLLLVKMPMHIWVGGVRWGGRRVGDDLS